MNTYVQGFKPPDEKYKAYKSIWDTCKAQMINPPEEVQHFFDYHEPSDHGTQIDIPHHDWDDGGMRVGIEVNVSDIPEGVSVIRFVNSY